MDTSLISKFYKGFLLCVIDLYNKYGWLILSKDKTGSKISNAFQKNLNESNRKSNKKWVNKGSEFSNKSIK